MREKWVPEIQKHWGQAPFLLVGTQMDLRNDPAKIMDLGKLYHTLHESNDKDLHFREEKEEASQH